MIITIEGVRMLDKAVDCTVWTMLDGAWKAHHGPRYGVGVTICEGNLEECCAQLHELVHGIQLPEPYHVWFQTRSLDGGKNPINVVEDGVVRFAILWCWSDAHNSPFDGQAESLGIPRNELPLLGTALLLYYRSRLAQTEEQKFLVWMSWIQHLRERAVPDRQVNVLLKMESAGWLQGMELSREKELLEQVMG